MNIFYPGPFAVTVVLEPMVSGHIASTPWSHVLPLLYFFFFFCFPLAGNSLLPHLEWMPEEPALHLHAGKVQPEYPGAGMQTLRAAGRRRRADLPAQLLRLRGK